ncbi:amidohydrolase family protein [Mesorhizobium sp. KR9-304]|uniref:amidohydrolase family protein n=1 Tax=Mesorhizobium sp. KR9-304 TaxID=3156614 RepID=UPI0032B34DD5
MTILSKRDFLQYAGATAATISVGGCALFRRPLDGRCFGGPDITNPRAHLAIDVHVHVFNATDLPVAAYLERVLGRDPKFKRAVQALSPIIERIGWWVAPSAGDELRRLNLAESTIRACRADESVRQIPSDKLTAQIANDRQEAYRKGRQEVVNALYAAPEYGDAIRRYRQRGKSNSSERDAVASVILQLPESVEEYRSSLKRPLISRREIGVRGAITFIMQCFQYRYVNVFDYLDGFARNADRSIDLMVCHMVDFDWPIADGRATLTPLKAQQDVMARISILAGGRVHCYAAYDPFRQVAHDLGLYQGESPLDLVRDAVERRGCIGVKLYPPMGFAPLGNGSIKPQFWERRWLPAGLKVADLGTRLDKSLIELYRWCVAEDVPIMAHTSVSLGPTDEFEWLATAQYWENVFNWQNTSDQKEFEGLRVNFGHFGDTDVVDGGPLERAEAYMKLMKEGDRPGHNAFADSAFFAEALSDPMAVRRRLKALLSTRASGENAPLADRLMYGSDWEMLTYLEDPYFEYLNKFVEIFDDLNSNSDISKGGRLADNFFGENAARYMGLRRGEPARRRLDKFYSNNRVSTPLWIHKLDGVVVASQ